MHVIIFKLMSTIFQSPFLLTTAAKAVNRKPYLLKTNLPVNESEKERVNGVKHTPTIADLITRYQYLVKSVLKQSKKTRSKNTLQDIAKINELLIKTFKKTTILFQRIAERLEQKLGQAPINKNKNTELNKFLAISLTLAQHSFAGKPLDSIIAEQSSPSASKHCRTEGITEEESLRIRMIDLTREFLIQFRNFFMAQLGLDRPIKPNLIIRFASFFDIKKQLDPQQPKIGMSIFRTYERRDGIFTLFKDTFIDKILEQSSQLVSVIKALVNRTGLENALESHCLSKHGSAKQLFKEIECLYKSETDNGKKNKLLKIAEGLSRLTSMQLKVINDTFTIGELHKSEIFELPKLIEEAESLACSFIDYFNIHKVNLLKLESEIQVDEQAIWSAFDFQNFIKSSKWKGISSDSTIREINDSLKDPSTVGSSFSMHQAPKGDQRQRLLVNNKAMKTLRDHTES